MMPNTFKNSCGMTF